MRMKYHEYEEVLDDRSVNVDWALRLLELFRSKWSVLVFVVVWHILRKQLLIEVVLVELRLEWKWFLLQFYRQLLFLRPRGEKHIRTRSSAWRGGTWSMLRRKTTWRVRKKILSFRRDFVCITMIPSAFFSKKICTETFSVFFLYTSELRCMRVCFFFAAFCSYIR